MFHSHRKLIECPSQELPHTSPPGSRLVTRVKSHHNLAGHMLGLMRVERGYVPKDLLAKDPAGIRRVFL